MKVIKYIIILTFMISAGVVKAQAPDWSVNPNDYSYNMTITGVINTDYTESVDENDRIAAFVGDECRGVASPVYREAVDRYICYLMVYSNASGETLNFKVYKAGSDAIIDIPSTKPFEVNGVIGYLDRPYVWSNPTLNDVADILTFTFPEDEQPAVIEGTNVDVLVKWGTDISSLTASFTLSEGADLLLDATEQESGVTTNDFSEPLVFTVRSEDEQLYLDYTITVSVMPNTAPEVELGYIEVPEATESGSVIFTVIASDYDNDVLTYTISEESVSERFEINSETGEITLLEAFDFETEDMYELTIQVNDSHQTVETIVEFQVTDSPEEPVVEHTEATITEATPIGIDILYPVATDEDAGDVLSYSFSAGNDEGKFSINAATGKVTVAQELDYETTSEYNLTIDVSDGIYTIPLNATVYIVDVQENPNAENLELDVNEDTEVGSVLGTVVAIDPDMGDALTYSFAIYSVMDEFAINSATGEISLAKAVNFEEENFYTLAVEITDGVFIEVVTVEITIVDIPEEPIVEEGVMAAVSEFAEIGTSIHTVEASDPDNDVLTFTFSEVSTEFEINSESGEITLIANIDYEIQSEYTFTVQVTDGTFTKEIPTTISVINIPEEPVVEDLTLEVSEDTAEGTSLGTVVATDADNDVLNFAFAENSPADDFAIDALTGEISLANPLDYERTNMYALTVEVSDPVFTKSVSVSIVVLDVAEDILPAVNAFTPDGDGVNDYWYIENVEIYDGYDLYIFNPAGKEIYHTNSYLNNWDGTYNGSPLPRGTYYYLFKGNGNVYKGTISIIRR